MDNIVRRIPLGDRTNLCVGTITILHVQGGFRRNPMARPAHQRKARGLLDNGRMERTRSLPWWKWNETRGLTEKRTHALGLLLLLLVVVSSLERGWFLSRRRWGTCNASL